MTQSAIPIRDKHHQQRPPVFYPQPYILYSSSSKYSIYIYTILYTSHPYTSPIVPKINIITTTTKMPFHILPCHPRDAPSLSEGMILARLTDPHWAFLFTDPSPAPIIASSTQRLPQNLTSNRPARRHEMVLDSDSNQPIAYCRWTLPPSLVAKGDVWLAAQVAEPTPEESAQYQRDFDAASDSAGRVPGMKSGELLEFRSEPLEKAEESVLQGLLKGEEVLTIEYLTTHPDFWRRGAGGMLVRRGTEIADQYGIKSYVMSEPDGLKVYLNSGFKVVDTVEVDYSRFGGQEPQVHYFMIREPVTVS
ncbi:hypothetical protein BO71DRAFT_201471 [Aspergillus ellipticus CBS 707.79]|uniref:N-acetyltransferase domain-containing protein n=1 Tax=Aspergillus ellipticus CBS 707.79 TaxID=1448320 RepID=A0A319DDL7_9EURO|nr:hypothetical protein BO71DRAFT_201471 [Aspergillus ellipticus CBS 707.79]